MQSNRISKPQAKQQRHFKKCKHCRDSRKRCEPQPRDWERLREKCVRCHKTGQLCGPSVEAPGKAVRTVGDSSASTITVQTPLSLIELDTPSTMPEWWVQNSMRIHQALESVLGAQQVIWKKYVTLQKYLQKAAVSCKLVSIRELLYSTHNWLLNESKRIATIGTALFMTMTPEEQKIWPALAVLQVACSRTLPGSNPPSLAGRRMQDLTFGIHPDLWNALDKLNLDGAGLFASVAHMNTDPRIEASTEEIASSHRVPLDRRLQKYANGELLIKTVLSSIPPQIMRAFGDIDFVRTQLSFAFPAAHLAYLNGDSTAALALWRQSNTRNQDVDVASMDLPHLIMASHDLNFLRDMCKHDTQMLRISSRDCLGLTLLQTATVLDYQDCVSVLLDRGVETDSQQELFDLAVDSNSPGIVSRILEKRVMQPPFTEHVRRAIINGYPEVVRTLYEQMRLYDHHSTEDIEPLVTLAEQHGHGDLASELRHLKQSWATADQAINDLLYLESILA